MPLHQAFLNLLSKDMLRSRCPITPAELYPDNSHNRNHGNISTDTLVGFRDLTRTVRRINDPKISNNAIRMQLPQEVFCIHMKLGRSLRIQVVGKRKPILVPSEWIDGDFRLLLVIEDEMPNRKTTEGILVGSSELSSHLHVSPHPFPRSR